MAGFLDLPREIRDMIYEYCQVVKGEIVPTQLPTNNPDSGNVNRSMSATICIESQMLHCFRSINNSTRKRHPSCTVKTFGDCRSHYPRITVSGETELIRMSKTIHRSKV